jgi:hypothetical protein
MCACLDNLIGTRVLAILWNGNHSIDTGLQRAAGLPTLLCQQLIKLMHQHYELKDKSDPDRAAAIVPGMFCCRW